MLYNAYLHSAVVETLTLEQRLTSSLRLCCMTLPPANRRKLHLLLRLMFKMSDNKELELERDEDQNLRDLVTFP